MVAYSMASDDLPEPMGGAEIKRARLARGISLNKLADITGISQPQLSRFENNKRDPRLTDLEKIAKALEVSVNSLLVGGKPPEGPTARPLSTPQLERMVAAAFEQAFGLDWRDAGLLARSIVREAQKIAADSPAPLDDEAIRARVKELIANILPE